MDYSGKIKKMWAWIFLIWVIITYSTGDTYVNESKIIKLGVILPYSGNFPWGIPRTGPGIMLAVETVNNHFKLQQGYTLNITMRDSKCSDTFGPLGAIDLYHKKSAHVFIGPACDNAVAPVARFSPYWNMPIITAGAPVTAFQDKKEQYRLLTRIGSTYTKLGEFFGKLFEMFNWHTVGYMCNNNLGWRAAKGRTDCYFVMEAIYKTLIARYQKKYNQPTYLPYRGFFDEKAVPPEHNFTQLLLEAAKEARGM